MAWVKLDDGFFNNRKIVSVSKDAKLIYLAGLCHSGGTLSDGFIPRNAVAILTAQCDVRSAGKAVTELVECGLWHVADGGYMIHDYLEHNTSSQTVQSKRGAAKERMQRTRSQNVHANNADSSQNVRPTKETETETETEIETETEQKPPKPPTPDTSAKPTEVGDERFDAFWDSYPKKVSKQAALKAFCGVNWRKVSFDAVMDAIEVQSTSAQWRKDGGQYIPNAATWLNGQKWTDELLAVGQTDKPHNQTQALIEQAKREEAEENEKARGNSDIGSSQHSVAREADCTRNGPSLLLGTGRRAS